MDVSVVDKAKTLRSSHLVQHSFDTNRICHIFFFPVENGMGNVIISDSAFKTDLECNKSRNVSLQLPQKFWCKR